MIIIVESGATKTDWCAVTNNGNQHRVKTAGMNFSTMSAESVKEIILEAIPQLNPNNEVVECIYFYAAGLIVVGNEIPKNIQVLNNVFKGYFPTAKIEYASDLLASARAVCGHQPGIAVILGTGSNSCFYDGEKILKNVRPGGFILGDEGGAACLGKLFVSDFLKGLVPEALAKEFSEKYTVDYMTIVQNVYKGSAPSKYLGEFAPFIVSNYEKYDYVKSLVEQNFRNLIERALMRYDIKKYPIGIVGGFGSALQNIFKKVGEEYGIKFTTILPSPIEGLIEYHTKCHK